MAGFKIFFKKSVEKDLAVIPVKDLRRVLQRIEMLIQNPRPPDCEKLTGQNRFRIRQGRYRILYSIQDQELVVIVVKVAHRKDAYR